MKRIVKISLMLLSLLVISCGHRHERHAERAPEPEGEKYVVTAAQLNVRASASRHASKVGCFSGGDTVYVLQKEGKWYVAVNRDQTIGGFISKKYLSKVEDTAPIDKKTEDNVATSAKAISSHDAAIGTPGGNIAFEDPLNLLSPEIRNHLVAAAAGQPLYYIIVAQDSVAEDKLIDFASSHYAAYKKSPAYKEHKDSMAVVCLVGKYGLVQADGGASALKYMRTLRNEDYWNAQQLGLEGDATGAMSSVMTLLGESQRAYDDLIWYKRWNCFSGNMLDEVCDGFIVDNILPHDSFWHKYLFGWLMKIPLRIALHLHSYTGNVMYDLILLGLMILVVKMVSEWVAFISIRRRGQMGNEVVIVGLLRRLIVMVAWLVLVAEAIYMTADATRVVLLQASGFPESDVMGLINQYSLPSLEKGWLMIVIYFVVAIIVAGFDAEWVFKASLPSYTQQQLYIQDRENIKTKLLTTSSSVTVDNLDKEAHPYSTLAASKGDAIGQVIGLGIPLMLVINGTLLIYLIIFQSIRLGSAIVQIVGMYVGYRMNRNNIVKNRL